MHFLHNLYQVFYFAPDNGSGGGSPANAGGSAGSAEAGTTANGRSTDKPDGSEAGDGEDSAEESQDAGKKFTQAELDKIIADRLKRQEAKIRKELETAKKKTEAEELEASQEWQTLAQKRQSQIQELEKRVAELEPLAEKVEKYEAALAGYRDSLLKGVPDHVKELLADKDIADQLTWLSTNATKFRKRAEGEDGGLSATPGATADQKLSAEERRKQAFRPSL